MRKVKIAQIGMNTNSHSTQIFGSLKKQTDLFEIAGYVLPENERVRLPEQVRHLEGYRELKLEEVLADPQIEAVAIETDEIYLSKYALLAARHGKHIHMEKPGGVCPEEFEKLILTVKETGKVFHTGYMYRYNPYVKELLQQIKAGKLGDIISVEAQMSCPHTAQVRQWLENFPGGMMFFLGCHLVDLILQIQGKPQRIIPLNKCTGKDGVRAQDYGMAVFEYPNGVSFAKTYAGELGGFVRRQLVVTGTKGTVELKPFEILRDGGQYTDRTVYTSEDWHQPGEKTTSDLYDRYDEMMASFAAMVRGEKENPYTCDYELELYRTLLQCCGGDDHVSG